MKLEDLRTRLTTLPGQAETAVCSCEDKFSTLGSHKIQLQGQSGTLQFPSLTQFKVQRSMTHLECSDGQLPIAGYSGRTRPSIPLQDVKEVIRDEMYVSLNGGEGEADEGDETIEGAGKDSDVA